MSSLRSNRGFTLFETVVATGIVITALAGIAQLLVLSAQWSRTAAGSNAALVAAQDKLEALRALSFGYDAGGTPVTDPVLEPSPPSSLAEDIDPYVDWIDRDGTVQQQPDGAVITRRWRVSRLPGTIPESIAIEVCTFVDEVADACLATVRTRQP